MAKSRMAGYLYVLIAATLWGISTVVAKSLLSSGVPPFQLVQVRLTLAALLLFLGMLLWKRRGLRLPLKDLLYLLVFGIVGMAGNQFTFYLTMSQIQVAPTVFIQYLAIVWIALYAFLLQKEPLSAGIITALLLAMAGCYLVVGGYRFDLLQLNRLGILFGILSSFFGAFYVLLGEKGLKRYAPWTLILYGFSFGALFYAALNPPFHLLSMGYPLKVWLAFFYIAIFATLIPFGLYFKGIERIRATRASITAAWEPVISALAAFLFLGEAMHPFQILGGVGVLASVCLLQITREKSSPLPSLELRKEKR